MTLKSYFVSWGNQHRSAGCPWCTTASLDPFRGRRLLNIGESWTPGSVEEGFVDYADPVAPKGKPYRVSNVVPGTVKEIAPPTPAELEEYLQAKAVAEKQKKKETFQYLYLMHH